MEGAASNFASARVITADWRCLKERRAGKTTCADSK